ncbi:MAG TPA: SagB/ThcOx family dehydrogenase [Oscillatoriaceae cyanobacterium M33_DOE_052]|uniref:SagB/ThcOx family dehydrogenase n=1 Tax=Planktothricoides sp. SpSt-374 TaxID=2282167 RepID=A0A7C3ZNE8_9CYAN|nr:SagB/ThcOx family dehydrogenase [Oscillatoriaceae cyanobacterium M33_DOE_052]
MPEITESLAQHFHERTKYHPETLAAKSRQLDWDNQPAPFKDYKIGVSIDLKPYLQSNPGAGSSESWYSRLSRLLFCTYGITGKILQGGTPAMGGVLYLRSAPSAGGLYPAEVYVIARGTSQLSPGLYNYQAKTHSLIRFWDGDLWSELQAACFWHPALETVKLAVVVTGVFYRSAWRYQDRAYRRIFLDGGHLLGNLDLAGSANDFRPHLVGGFDDRLLAELLYLNPEEEAPIALIPLADLLDINQNLPPYLTALPSNTHSDYPEIPDGELLAYCHRATEISEDTTGTGGWSGTMEDGLHEDKYNFPFCTKVSTQTAPINWGENLEGLTETIVKRRSTRAYSAAAIALEELNAVLDFTYQPQHYTRQVLDGYPDYFDLSLISTFIAVSSVTGLEEGCYYYASLMEELRQIRFKNFRRELHYLCLGQELGRDAAVVVFHTADLKKAVAKYGDRAYRYLHMDAGHLGQRLNLAAIYLGLGVSGIGGFFDDQVNEVLGIPHDEAVLYITTIGRSR